MVTWLTSHGFVRTETNTTGPRVTRPIRGAELQGSVWTRNVLDHAEPKLNSRVGCESKAEHYRSPTDHRALRMLSYYDPTTGQFLTSDPAFTATLSAYGYANNDPINGSDPTGLCFGVCIAIITVVTACIESGWGEDVGGFLGAEGGLSAEAELEASEAAGGIDGGPPCPEYGPDPEPAGEPPEAPPATPVRMLTSSEQESIKSLQWQIMEHESKL